MPTWMLNLWAGYQTHVVSPLYFNADVGQTTANTIKTIANDLKIAALVGMGASIMWGAGLFGIGGEEAARKAKKRWIQASVGIVVCIAAWFLLSWLEGYANQNFSE